jgi:hypothetical protein
MLFPFRQDMTTVRPLYRLALPFTFLVQLLSMIYFRKSGSEFVTTRMEMKR